MSLVLLVLPCIWTGLINYDDQTLKLINYDDRTVNTPNAISEDTPSSSFYFHHQHAVKQQITSTRRKTTDYTEAVTNNIKYQDKWKRKRIATAPTNEESSSRQNGSSGAS